MNEAIIDLPSGPRTRVIDTGGNHATPIVLIHGLANSIEIWSRVLPRLAAHHRVIAFDLPGFGQADRPDGAYDGAFFARHLGALLDRLAVRRAHLVGSSLGASVALHYAASNLDRVDRVVLAAPGGFGRRTHPLMRLPALPLFGTLLGRPSPANNRCTLRLAIYDRRHITPELIALTDRYAAMPGSDRSFVRTLQSGVGLRGGRDLTGTAARAAALHCPALVLWGQQDRVFPAAYAHRAADLLPEAHLQLIDRCGHYPHWEQPEEFVAAVTRFLA